MDGAEQRQSINQTSLKQEIEEFVQSKRAAVNVSNQEEFLETVEDTGQAARTNTREIERESHIRASVVDNQEGPLSRSLIASTSGKLVSPHGVAVAFDGAERPVFNALEERVRNIETHLGIVVAPLDKSLVQRVKILEDKILKIEQFYPQIAAHVFNYGKAEVEASSKPGGRVSRIPGLSTGGNKKRTRDEILQEEGGEDEELALNHQPDESSLGELKRRMNDVKSRLLKSSK
jgi:hypothetical protein